MGFHLITLDFQNIQYIETVQINEISSEYIFLFNIHIPPPPQKKFLLQRKSVKMWKYWSEQFSDAYSTV